ncbi:MAG TPA: NAD(P)-dependent oxidoreductase [Gaiellaceae bacterium]|nr:NAD(P)-dependent oxidoreductase [Gaiellaceae bacterium]
MRVGWIGTGVMGSSMCGHVLDAGYAVTVFTRSRERAQALLDRGAEWADSPAAIAAASDAVFSIVGYPSDVRAVILGEDGVLAGAAPGTVAVDMTTSEPALAQEIYAAAKAQGVEAVDAPVSGGDVGARNGTLSIMVGGDETAIERVRPMLETMGSSIIRQGGPGAGQHTKMVNQVLIATGMIGVCEALIYAYRAGLDLERVLESVSGGAAGSWSLTNYAPRMLAGDFAPGFVVDHFVKDMGIALAEAKRARLALPGLALAEQLYVALQAQGHGRKGTQSLILALAALSDIDWEGR